VQVIDVDEIRRRLRRQYLIHDLRTSALSSDVSACRKLSECFARICDAMDAISYFYGELLVT
jgi:hypothetical protein